MADIRVIHGDMREQLRVLRDDGVRVQSVVTDPPYHLTAPGKGGRSNLEQPADKDLTTVNAGNFRRLAGGFMGKQWDGGDIAFQAGTWRLCFDLLPPGGHLLAFAGTRTYHRMACAIEDAGFEIRDTIAWLYGSGFPKSHNVSKGIDRAAGAEREVIGRGVRPIAGTNSHAGIAGSYGRQDEYDLTTPATAAARQWDGWGSALKPSMELVCVARKPLIGTIASNVLRYGTGALNIDKCRITTGQLPDGNAAWEHDQNLCASCAEDAESTTKPGRPATEASTATKPVAPILSGKDTTNLTDTGKTAIGCCDGTLADTTDTNLSIGVSGQASTDLFPQGMTSTTSTATGPTTGLKTCSVCHVPLTPQNTRSIKHQPRDGQPMLHERESTEPKGRWPSNTCHDGSAEVVKAFPESDGAVSNGRTGKPNDSYSSALGAQPPQMPSYADSGSAARFFYSSKADADDRLGSKHPTVKPVDLMRWLVRLVTPPDGTVLDPFAGSGTTGMACMAEGFDAILVEREAEYVADIKARIAHVHGEDTPLFAVAADD